ncbi:MAG: hypothetical protein NC391_04610 [Alistipes timonensis]|nr:hypothetical protein [Alistipes timonensis]
MRIHLNDSGVLFNSEEHTYLLGDKYLSGITPVIERQLYPNTYDGIPETVIKRAADYGSAVHEELDRFDTLWENSGSQEVADYIQLCAENGLTHEASEYTVTDGENYASNIDKVFRVSDNEFDLADVKTYSTLDSERFDKARWQLSLYGMMFESLNPKAKVRNLYIIHLRNKNSHICQLIPVSRIPADICAELLSADLNGEQFVNPYAIPDEIKSQEEHIRDLILTKQATEQELAELKSSILTIMEAQGVKSYQGDHIRITRKLPTTRSSFVMAAFKEANPTIDLEPYMRTSNVAGSVTITI